MSYREVTGRVPMPFCGVLLATSSLGNVLGGFVPAVRWAFFVLALCMLALVLSKVVLFTPQVLRDLNDLDLIGTSSTFFMALLFLTTYVRDLSFSAGFILWLFVVVVFFAAFARFIVLVVKRRAYADIAPVWTVMTVGTIVSILTGTSYGLNTVLDAIFAVDALSAAVTVTASLVRLVVRPMTAKAVRPTFCVLIAPPSMVLTCYLALYGPANFVLVTIAYLVACVFYAFGLVNAVRCLKGPFYPTFAGMTFPFIISAVCTQNVAGLFFMQTTGALGVLAAIQLVIAVVIWGVVVVRYAVFFRGTPPVDPKPAGR